MWLYDPQNLKDIDAAVHLVLLELRQHHLALSRYEICLDIETEVDEETGAQTKLGCYYIWDKDAENIFWLQETLSSFVYDGVDVKILGGEHLSMSLSQEELTEANVVRCLYRTRGENRLLVIVFSSWR